MGFLNSVKTFLFGSQRESRCAEQLMPQSQLELQKEIQSVLESTQKDVSLLNSTTNPVEFFEGYDRLLKNVQVLARAEERISFSGKSPRSMLAELNASGKRAAVINAFLDRCLSYGRWNAQSQAMEDLRPYWQKIPESCREKLCVLPELSPEEYQEENWRCIKAFEEAHDLKTVQGIRAITAENAKKWERRAAGVPSLPEQILSKTATQYKKDGNMELAIECLRKANELYATSDMMYDEKTYMRLVRYLQAAGRFDEARAEEKKIKERFEPEQDQEKRRKEFLAKAQAEANEAGTDLVEASWVGVCCETCGKYRGRVFSVTGKNKEYPKLPDDFCGDCGLMLFPFWEGISEPAYYSLRRLRELNLMPMRDTRTSEESALYERRLSDLAAEKKDRDDYAWLQEHLPEIAPKSFGGYRRMKNSNSNNFQKLVCAAQEKGRKLE